MKPKKISIPVKYATRDGADRFTYCVNSNHEEDIPIEYMVLDINVTDVTGGNDRGELVIYKIGDEYYARTNEDFYKKFTVHT